MLLIFWKSFSILLRKLANGIFCSQQQVPLAIVARCERVRITEQEFDAILFKVELFNDVWSQKARKIRGS